MTAMLSIWFPWMISNTSCMDMYNGIPPLSTPNIVSSQQMAQGESNMSWEFEATLELDSHLSGVARVAGSQELNHQDLVISDTFHSSVTKIIKCINLNNIKCKFK